MIVPVVLMGLFSAACFLMAGPGWSAQEQWLKATTAHRIRPSTLAFYRFMYVVCGVGIVAMGVFVVLYSVSRGTF
jgi:hypothetical protein